MPLEKSAGAVIFRKEKSEIKYLLLNYPSRKNSKRAYWDLPKGHIEKGEKELDTVKREVMEETGLSDIGPIDGFKEWIKYFFVSEGKKIFKIVTFYLAETQNAEVKISSEHIGYEWLSYEKAVKKLTFKNAKEIVRKANEYLEKKRNI